jgi:hypothetical protein
MKKYLLPAMIAAFILSAVTSCSKSGGSGSGSPIANGDDAKAAFIKINTLYTTVLKKMVTKNTQKFTNFILADSGGRKMIANGEYSVSGFSGSSGSTSTTTIDVDITFQDYRSGDLELNGTIRFYDWNTSRTDCGSGGCATASHKDLAYETPDTSAAGEIAIKFNNNGKAIADNISLTSDKEFSTFSVTLRNAKREKFSFTY